MKCRKSYSAALKLDALKYRDIHGISVAAINFDLTEKIVRKWVADREKLVQMPATKRAWRYKKPGVEEVEDEIYNWVIQNREKNRAVKVIEIRTRTKNLAEKLGYRISRHPRVGAAH